MTDADGIGWLGNSSRGQNQMYLTKKEWNWIFMNALPWGWDVGYKMECPCVFPFTDKSHTFYKYHTASDIDAQTQEGKS